MHFSLHLPLASLCLLQDTFTSTAAAAIEWGAWEYAKGVIDNWLRFYVRTNGGITYRAEETPLSARMLTLFAQYVSMTGDEALLLSHFPKAKALGDWLLNRHRLSLAYPADDPRHGIPAGNDEGDTFIGTEYDDGSHWQHYYASAAEAHRGFQEMGKVRAYAHLSPTSRPPLTLLLPLLSSFNCSSVRCGWRSARGRRVRRSSRTARRSSASCPSC